MIKTRKMNVRKEKKLNLIIDTITNQFWIIVQAVTTP